MLYPLVYIKIKLKLHNKDDQGDDLSSVILVWNLVNRCKRKFTILINIVKGKYIDFTDDGVQTIRTVCLLIVYYMNFPKISVNRHIEICIN